MTLIPVFRLIDLLTAAEMRDPRISSFPRKPEPSVFFHKRRWVPAFAGTTIIFILHVAVTTSMAMIVFTSIARLRPC